MTLEEQFLCIVSNDALRRVDAIVVLEGDGLARITTAAKLFKEGFAPVVVISGGVVNPPHSIPAQDMLPYLVELGVPKQVILLEDKSQNTREQGIEIMKFSSRYNWKSIIIVASHYHQYRAYLTFLKAMQESGQKIIIINAPVRDLKWFANDEQGRRVDLLRGEFERISSYFLKGHIASYEDAIAYQEWKESQLK